MAAAAREHGRPRQPVLGRGGAGHIVREVLKHCGPGLRCLKVLKLILLSPSAQSRLSLPWRGTRAGTVRATFCFRVYALDVERLPDFGSSFPGLCVRRGNLPYGRRSWTSVLRRRVGYR